MTINEIIDYVTHSPENTNPNVLRSMLRNQVSGGQDIPEGAFIAMPISCNLETGTLEKTWQEIDDLLGQNIICLVSINNDILFLDTTSDTTSYIITTNNNQITFTTNEPNGYPVAISSESGEGELEPGSNAPINAN